MYNTITAGVLQDTLDDRSSTGRLRPWRQYKLLTNYLAMVYEDIDEKKSAAMAGCASDLAFSVTPEGGKRLERANFCRVRLCPMCQWRRAVKVYGQTMQIVEAMQRDRAWAFAHVVLTLQNCTGDELAENVDLLVDGYRRLIRRAPWMRAVKGYYRALEVTHNVDPESPNYDTYHPHLHILCAVNPSYFTSRDYISQARLTSLWADCCRLDYTPIVHMHKLKGCSAADVAEVAKYTVKFSDYVLPEDWNLTLVSVETLDRALSGRRLVSYGGVMADYHKALQLDDADDGDLVHVGDGDEQTSAEDLPLIWYSWHSGYSQYKAVRD